MKRGNAAVALEVGVIEGQDGFYGIYVHESHEAGVVYLDALDLVVLDDGFPGCVDSRNIR